MRIGSLSLLALIGFAGVMGILLQTTAFHLVPSGDVIPDFVLILCVYLGLHQHSVGGTAAAFLLGYFTDNFSGETVGLNAFAMSLVFLLVYLVSRRLWMDHWVSNIAVVFVASVLKTLTVAVLLGFYLSVEYPWAGLVSQLWFDALLAALFTPLVFVTLDRGRRLARID